MSSPFPFRTLPWVLAALSLLVGCRHHSPPRSGPPQGLTLATTTSVRDSGLLDALLPSFRDETGIEVRVIAVGSGQALELGRRGDADVLLTHSPAAEEKFVQEGWGLDRLPLMHNDFVLVGPTADPAHCAGQPSIVDCFRQLARQHALFISRGDESGTHQKEQQIWQQSGGLPSSDTYLRAGSGMAQVLRMAHEKQAYTLADRGTFLALRSQLELAILFQGDPQLLNHYALILVHPQKHPRVATAAGQQLVDFLTRPSTQQFIGRFGVESFGEPLFYPAAKPPTQ